ncbi:DNA-protecting protein DprA [Candidatus Dependentiae bacterium]|nr:MAG: DNA-protecting protein DprA [Candidatus Dependentiae bacterium]
MDDSFVFLHLSLIDGIGPVAIHAIIEKKLDSLHELYQVTASDLVETFGFSYNKAHKIVLGLSNKLLLEQEVRALEQHQIGWLTILDENYPSLLKHIYMPPAVMYWQGTPLEVDESCIAVVGSRAMDWYGKKAIEQLIPSLVENGWTVVSGGAIGADSYAHRTTVEVGGKTIVVLGSGILCPYPFCNKQLFETVIEAGGTVISPFALHTVAHPGNFPARNRIIAGLSRGCIVIQAGLKSGASITAQFSLDQGRDVFAVPGPIDNKLSAGCHALIKEGAKLVHSAQDILEEYGQVDLKGNERQSGTNRAQKLVTDHISEQILTCCTNPTTLDELAEITGLSVSVLHERLFELQLQGVVCQQMGLWKRC